MADDSRSNAGAVEPRSGADLQRLLVHGPLFVEEREVEPPLRTREEVAYYRIFAEVLGEVRPGHTIGRFATA